LFVGFGVLIAVVMKSLIFWDITPSTFNRLHDIISQKMGLFIIFFFVVPLIIALTLDDIETALRRISEEGAV
jgi:hypothetical protein